MKILVFAVASVDALLTNTDWRVVLNIHGHEASAATLPLPLSLRFGGDEIMEKVDSLLQEPRKLEALSDTASVVTKDRGEQAVPLSAIGWTEDVDHKRSLVKWAVDFPEGATRGDAELPPGRIYASAQLWKTADLNSKRRALGRLQESMSSLEGALGEWNDDGINGLLRGLADRRRLDERIVALEAEVPSVGTEVVAVPGDPEAVIEREGVLSTRQAPNGVAGWLHQLQLCGDDAQDVQIGTFSLRPLPASAAASPHARSHARSTTPTMGLFDALPGFWKSPVPDGYARASHALFLGTDAETEASADAVLERIRRGDLTFAQAAREYSCCPTREQEPAGDLGTFASLSAMAKVDEMRTFEGVMELPYEGQNTRDFDDAIFSVALNEPTKVRSQWGFHLVLVTERGAGERAIIAPETPSSASPAPSTQVKNDAGRSL